MATGLLPIGFGEATKFSQHLLDANKVYRARMRLGQKTTTADAEGEILEERPVPRLTRDEIESVLQPFRGNITQVPSMFSALKKTDALFMNWRARDHRLPIETAETAKAHRE